MTQYRRGLLYLADIGLKDQAGRVIPKYMLVVSNNARNRSDTALAVRVTTTSRPYSSFVPLASTDPLAGYVNCDDIVQLYEEDRVSTHGGVLASTMRSVEAGLKVALGIH